LKATGLELSFKGPSRALEGHKYHRLIRESISDVFFKMDLRMTGKIQEAEWLHYWLLERQAPSSDALAQINEKLRLWLQVDPTILAFLNKLFLESCGERKDAQLTASQLRSAVEVWLAEMIQRYKKNDVVTYLEELLVCDVLDEDELLSYYDFMNHMLGRRKAAVQLYQYDLSKGAAKWLSPLLMGKQLEGLWHTSVVVHGKEYWFGGGLFESDPGETLWGKPDKILDAGATMRTQIDLVNHLARTLSHKFNKESYDILTHNCNHFADAAFMFLLNCHIPQEVLLQPKLVMDTWTMQMARPVLNRTLGGFEANESAKGLESTIEERLTSFDGASVKEGVLVSWQQHEGWARIARVESACKDSRTYVLKWIDLHTGQLHTETQVKSSHVRRLTSSV